MAIANYSKQFTVTVQGEGTRLTDRYRFSQRRKTKSNISMRNRIVNGSNRDQVQAQVKVRAAGQQQPAAPKRAQQLLLKQLFFSQEQHRHRHWQYAAHVSDCSCSF